MIGAVDLELLILTPLPAAGRTWKRKTHAEAKRRAVPDREFVDRGAMAYVVDGSRATYVTEAAYRAKGYDPAFEDLPPESEYDVPKG